MYIFLDAIRKGFLDGCKKCLGLDGCFLKGVVKGMLLTSVGKDLNNQMFSLAWAIIEIESKSSWTCNLKHSENPFDFVDKSYSKDKFIIAYNYPIKVVGNEEFWPNIGHKELLPPLPKAWSVEVPVSQIQDSKINLYVFFTEDDNRLRLYRFYQVVSEPVALDLGYRVFVFSANLKITRLQGFCFIRSLQDTVHENSMTNNKVKIGNVRVLDTAATIMITRTQFHHQSSNLITMSTLNFAEVHNMIAYLSKPTESVGFEQIIDFLNAHPIKYALTVNPTIYTSCVEQFWATATVKNINEEAQLHAKPSGPTTNVADEALNEKNVPTQSNDPTISRVNTLGSGEDKLKLNELMELCTKLSERVLNLETTKNAQAKEISRLKKRVKRLEKKKKSSTHELKRLYKVRLSARVESSDQESLEDQRRINNEEMFDTNVLNDDEMFTESVDVAEQAKEIIFDKDLIDDITLAKALMEIKVTTAGTRPKAKCIVMQDPSETPTTTTIPISSKVQDKGKARRLQAEIDEQDRLAEEKAQKIEDENLAWDNVQAKMDADYELAARLQEEEQGELTVEEKSRLFVELMDKRKKHFAKLKAFDKTMSWINSFVPMESEVVKDKEVPTQESSSKRARNELDQERSKKQKVEDDKEFEELKRCLEIIPYDGDDVTIDATPLSIKTRSTKKGKRFTSKFIEQMEIHRFSAASTKLMLPVEVSTADAS
uniref:Uncharacterized protein n=1 Tax=Tanacetum cinerariifolium TaxID=118510 RepID=A0A6L2MR93_TANCI|nr:hypothetical protein [Tanacetum cinerariifolium]